MLGAVRGGQSSSDRGKIGWRRALLAVDAAGEPRALRDVRIGALGRSVALGPVLGRRSPPGPVRLGAGLADEPGRALAGRPERARLVSLQTAPGRLAPSSVAGLGGLGVPFSMGGLGPAVPPFTRAGLVAVPATVVRRPMAVDAGRGPGRLRAGGVPDVWRGPVSEAGGGGLGAVPVSHVGAGRADAAIGRAGAALGLAGAETFAAGLGRGDYAAAGPMAGRAGLKLAGVPGLGRAGLGRFPLVTPDSVSGEPAGVGLPGFAGLGRGDAKSGAAEPDGGRGRAAFAGSGPSETGAGGFFPAGVAAPAAVAAGGGGGVVMLDGRLVGRWLADSMGREAGRAPAGMTRFDARGAAAWSASGVM